MKNSARSIVRDVFPRRMADEIWSGLYNKVLPISFNDFELSAVLPAVFYMFRFGNRRGRGKFLETFAPEGTSNRERRQAATVERIVDTLSDSRDFQGLESDVAKAILGDLLLCFCLENSKHDLGRDKQVQRVAPAHFMSSWIDLPESAAHLRFVPEMIVAMLADQKGETVVWSESRRSTWFPVGKGHQDNLLLKAFSHGIRPHGPIDHLASDKFDEHYDSIGIDQLLMIRLSQKLGSAPDKVRGRDSTQISNQRPISEKSARDFSEDIRRFVRSYANVAPRHAFVDLLEACIATGMTAILTSVVEILCEWVETGKVTDLREQSPAGVFVDCSNGVENRSRVLAEQSLDDLMRRIERVPEILMLLRLLDYVARDDRNIRKLEIPSRPYATAWLELLGDLLHGRRPEAAFVHYQMEGYSEKLADALDNDYPEAARALRDDRSQPNAIRRLAAALTRLMGGSPRTNAIGMVDSTLNIGRPNGLAQKRKTTRGVQAAGSGRRQRDVRSLVFTDSVLDYLVHLHLLRTGHKAGVRSLSLRQFLERIRTRYGFHVDFAAPGMTVSNDLLQLNRAILERRLRDLGLLAGVNDAEEMKRLQPRFRPHAGD